MGFEYELFIATTEELRDAFVGWRRPVAVPVERKKLNPFTGQEEPFLTWVADPADGRPVSPRSDTAAYSTARLRHLESSRMDPRMLGELLAEVLGTSFETAMEGLFNPPPLVDGESDSSAQLTELPESFAKLAASWSDPHVVETAVRWAQSMAEDEAPDPPDVLAGVLSELRALAVEGLATERRLYYFIAP